MPQDSIASKLKQFQNETLQSGLHAKLYSDESPLERTKKEVLAQIAAAESYRVGILKTVSTFSGRLGNEAYATAAQSMEEVFYQKGDNIIEQDDMGDSFYILEQGDVKVTRKLNSRDTHEVPKEIAQLHKNSHFGEISLLTAEPRSATITVISDWAKCLCMTKQSFDQLVHTSSAMQAENRRIIGRDVLDTVPLFKAMAPTNRKKLLDCMVPMTYMPGSYICRQGTAGNSFFILTEGVCRVTVNKDDRNELDVAKLKAGDFFGEVALVETSNRRTANVVSVDNVSCLTLNRNDFNRLLKTMKVKILEHAALRTTATAQAHAAVGGGDGGGGRGSGSMSATLAKKRRVSVLNIHNHRDDTRAGSMLKRFGKYTTECLWNSMYSRFYREMLLDSYKCAESGRVGMAIMKHNDNRNAGVNAIHMNARRILESEPSRRNPVDHAFICALLKQKSALTELLCRNWPPHQFLGLCRRIKMMRVKAFRKICEVETKGTCAFIILRGAVRIFRATKSISGGISGNSNNKDGEGSSEEGKAGASPSSLYFEEDLVPGEIFGRSALNGEHLRNVTAQAITDVELAVVEDEDYIAAQDRDSMHLSVEDRTKFLHTIPIFKDWDTYKLVRIAHALMQEEIHKGVVVTKPHHTSRDLYFVLNGRIDVVSSLERKHVITTILRGDYFGESGLLNRYVQKQAHRVGEEQFTVTATRVDILVLRENFLHLFDIESIDHFRNAFLAKQAWQRQRVIESKHERARLRKHVRTLLPKTVISAFPHEALPALRKAEEDEKVIQQLQETATRNQKLGLSLSVNTATSVVDHHTGNTLSTRSPEHHVKIVHDTGHCETALKRMGRTIRPVCFDADRRADGGATHTATPLRISASDNPPLVVAHPEVPEYAELPPSPRHTYTYRGDLAAWLGNIDVSRTIKGGAATKQSSDSIDDNDDDDAAAKQAGIGFGDESDDMIYHNHDFDETGVGVSAGHKKRDLVRSRGRLQATGHNDHKPEHTVAGGVPSQMDPASGLMKLVDLEDIPSIFVHDMDPFMITAAVKSHRTLQTIQNQIAYARRPKSSRVKERSALDRAETGFRSLQQDRQARESLTDEEFYAAGKSVASSVATEKERNDPRRRLQPQNPIHQSSAVDQIYRQQQAHMQQMQDNYYVPQVGGVALGDSIESIGDGDKEPTAVTSAAVTAAIDGTGADALSTSGMGTVTAEYRQQQHTQQQDPARATAHNAVSADPGYTPHMFRGKNVSEAVSDLVKSRPKSAPLSAPSDIVLRLKSMKFSDSQVGGSSSSNNINNNRTAKGDLGSPDNSLFQRQSSMPSGFVFEGQVDIAAVQRGPSYGKLFHGRPSTAKTTSLHGSGRIPSISSYCHHSTPSAADNQTPSVMRPSTAYVGGRGADMTKLPSFNSGQVPGTGRQQSAPISRQQSTSGKKL